MRRGKTVVYDKKEAGPSYPQPDTEVVHPLFKAKKQNCNANERPIGASKKQTKTLP